jgi:hypothetical protein
LGETFHQIDSQSVDIFDVERQEFTVARVNGSGPIRFLDTFSYGCFPLPVFP